MGGATLAAVRLGNRQGGGERRGGRGTRRGGAVVILTVAALLLTGGPARPAPSAAAAASAGPSDRSPDPQRPSPHDHGAEPAGDGMPSRFVAGLDGRIVIVSAGTGRVVRSLTSDVPGGGAANPAVTPDGRTVWFSRGDGTCAAHLASVPLAGGAERKLPGSGEAGPESLPLPRPRRAQIAYARASCSDSGEALVVGDLRGVEGHGQLGLEPLQWSRDGDHLLAATPDGSEVRLLDINPAGAIVADQVLNPGDPASGCALVVFGFSPDNNGGYVAERRCGSSDGTAVGRRSLVLLDRGGVIRQILVRLARGQGFVDQPAFDTTGHSLLFSTAAVQSDTTQGGPVSLWVWRDGEIRLLARQSGYRHPAWLP